LRNVYPVKCLITNAAAEGEPARVEVYDDIGEGGWFSEGLTAKAFSAQLASVRGPLDVHINSYGGDVADGLAIASTIRGHKGHKRTIVDGMACSAASVILQAGDERIVEPGGMVMIHDASGGCVGNPADMASFAEVLGKISDNIAQQYADRAGGTAADWREVMRGEKWYTADEAVEAGLADRKGSGQAALPAGLDLAAFAIPDRIAARLRSLPVAKLPDRPQAATHPLEGDHSHSHSAYGHGSADDDGMHTHMHSHDGDGDHGHSHAEPGAQDHGHGPQGHGTGPEQTCADLGHQCCQDAASAKALLAGLVADAIADWKPPQGAQGQPGTHGDHERFDPDGDGDCDACPDGDTDHDYWAPDGTQLKSVPGKPMPDDDGVTEDRLTPEGAKALFDEWLAGIRDAASDFDESPWDASKAWHNGAESDDPAAFYDGICAGKKAGDPATQDAHALPYKYKPTAKPNVAGVQNALSRLPQTDGLTNEQAAKDLLQGLMKKINPDYEPEDRAPARVNVAKLAQQLGTALKGASE
jgi:ATP-dependent protease ClpP protease subunit